VIEGNYWKGNLHISLKGKKLKGEWSLSRDRAKGEAAWILKKIGESARTVSARPDDASAITGRTMAQIAAARDKTWQNNVQTPEKR
jgi:bifunctional non-homologous end joining protein LigD